MAAIRQHSAGIEELVTTLDRGEPGAVVEYFTAALYASSGWPEDFPRQVSASFDPAARQLILNWELPGYAIVPEVSLVRYMPSADRDKESRRPATERRGLYRDRVHCQAVVCPARERPRTRPLPGRAAHRTTGVDV